MTENRKVEGLVGSVSGSSGEGWEKQFDLLVLGAGSAAFAGAIRARDLGARVAIVERKTLGGTCVNRGCIPSKNLLRAAELAGAALHEGFPGIRVRGELVDYGAVVQQKRDLVADLRKMKYEDLLAEYGIDLIQGHARFRSALEVEVDAEVYTADRFLVATGGRPLIPPIPGLSEAPYLTSSGALELEKVAPRLVVIGGGYIGVELAQMFARFGSRVTIIEMLPRIIANHEPEQSAELARHLEAEGIVIRTGMMVVGVRRDGAGVVVRARGEGREEEFRADSMLVAAGIMPNTDDLGADAAGVALDARGAIVVDEEMRTSVPHIYAAGDCTTVGPALVTTAAHTAAIAVQNALNGTARKVDLRAVPSAIFTDPQVASVGMREEEARARGFKVRAEVVPLSLVPKALAIRDTRGLVKMIVEEETQRILGVHMVAPLAADLIHEATLAVRFGLTAQDLVDTIHVYPTLSEALKLVAQAFTRDVAKLSCCAE
ncbi:MAG: mercury(II) reductase [Gemmatimonadetes bacterium]|nr:mercury(II) reductase [Gemmatimonadota bacterium]